MANAYKSKITDSSDKLIDLDHLKDQRESISFNVGGMTCSHCKESVESAIKSFDDVLDTSIDLSSGKVVVIGSKLDAIAIKQKIEDKGFSIA